MIFIGGMQPKTRNLENNPRTCPACGLPQAYLRRTDHYISFFFIPIIPVRRGQPFLACAGCREIFNERGESVSVPSAGRKRCSGCGEAVETSFTYCPYCGRRI